ncbi:urease accessory protein D isoform X2 [Phalaenopsis equestris]|nr:urease accessory protein D isoform X2 [Phalaenopsis equestris]XP_020573244.1 urease accessory protein D isoform X2 [Phalaenopsis equestris]XP_020573245.1 urease accessory protein D isoform X2 [Phalaenopsis equestris]XP_020573246.1 urease accessory protein D isoform X2 [Phalaenopsis equestris]XP_020573247.1 urease accessory protein D isoform X2 [Phalaenopsis equestris]
MEETGILTVEKIDGKSTATRCFSKYPLKLIIPKKVGSSTTDAVWVFSLSYGGGIVSGDRVAVGVSVGDGCAVALTTQASTKVYKSIDSKCSEQFLEAKVGRNALLAVIPDPVTCFSTARYAQKQIFQIFYDSNLVIVDWITSGRYESGEKWDFELYKSSNNILFEGGEPLFVDSVLLEQRSTTSIAERMKDYQVVAMVVILGPKLKHIQDLIQTEVEHLMSGYFRPTTVQKLNSDCANGPSKPPLFASCSSFGAKAGLVVRLLSTTTEAVYSFLSHHLGGLEQFLGAPPYRR